METLRDVEKYSKFQNDQIGKLAKLFQVCLSTTKYYFPVSSLQEFSWFIISFLPAPNGVDDVRIATNSSIEWVKKRNLGRSSADRGALMSYEHWLVILCNTEHRPLFFCVCKALDWCTRNLGVSRRRQRNLTRQGEGKLKKEKYDDERNKRGKIRITNTKKMEKRTRNDVEIEKELHNAHQSQYITQMFFDADWRL